jgi:hypothetical protein
MRNTANSLIPSKRTSQKRGNDNTLQNFHTLSKVSLYEHNIQTGKVALERVKRQLDKLEKALAEFKNQGGDVKKQLPAVTIKTQGINLTIDPSFSSLANDPFIVEKNKRAELKLSKKAQ